MSNSDEPWLNIAAWEAAVEFGTAVIVDCICETSGPFHISVTSMGGAVIAVCICLNCGGILSTASDG